MKRIKGISKLNKAISTPLMKRFDITCAEFDEEFNYNYTTNRVGYTLLTGGYSDIWFKEFVEERFNFKVTEENEFIISILHEVGHAKNNEEICDNILDFCEKEKFRINILINKAEDLEEARKLEFQYFNLPDEIMATAWAVSYMREHPRIVKRMSAEMMKAIFNFYAENITD